MEAMPTFVFLKEGKLLEKFAGANKEKLLQTILKHNTDSATGASTASA